MALPSQLRIDVSTADPHASVHAYVPGTSLALAPPVSLEYPLVLPARARNSYFVEREAFNPLDMLKSPMMLLMLVTGGMVFVMPYLMVSGACQVAGVLPNNYIYIRLTWTRIHSTKLQGDITSC